MRSHLQRGVHATSGVACKLDATSRRCVSIYVQVYFRRADRASPSLQCSLDATHGHYETIRQEMSSCQMTGRIGRAYMLVCASMSLSRSTRSLGMGPPPAAFRDSGLVEHEIPIDCGIGHDKVYVVPESINAEQPRRHTSYPPPSTGTIQSNTPVDSRGWANYPATSLPCCNGRMHSVGLEHSPLGGHF